MQNIPKELQSLVYWSTGLLGECIREQYGNDTFQLVEKTRRDMKSIRAAEHAQAVKVLMKKQASFAKASDRELRELAHSFSLMLELINRCESAYRYVRLQGKKRSDFKQKPHAVIFVFTAHPTEARSQEILQIFQEIYHLLNQGLRKGFEHVEERLKFYLGLALSTSMARSAKPTVEDEAQYLYSYILRDEIISQQIKFAKEGTNVSFRSWVGGDKDGHPGVSEKTMLMSLNLSRKNLVIWIQKRLENVFHDLKFIESSGQQQKNVKDLIGELKKIGKISSGDGTKIANFKKKFKKVAASLEKTKIEFPDMTDISTLLWIYPAIVLPLEVREDAEVVHEAVDNKKLPIYKMLLTLNEISKGYKAKWYVRGFILSMSEQSRDIEAGLKVQKKAMGSYAIPVVPLFETANALENAVQILSSYFKDNREVKKAHQKGMNSRFEVMLGYSDSSKESGVFPSRFLISRALDKMDKFFLKEGLTPVFFHGSGGSVERGGGSVREQTEWWPKSAVHIFKATTQGEMIARNFQSDMIMQSQVDKILEELNFKKKRDAHSVNVMEKLCKSIQSHYQELVGGEAFREDILAATPYQYLDVLKIGSRPSKRQTPGARLRAIPWVLCWTQTRVLMPTWWGVGSAFEKLSPKEKDELKSLFNKDKLLSSYFKILGFTLRKVELPIFEIYLSAQHESSKACSILKEFRTEYEKALKCFYWVTGESELLWFRPWLSQSIYYRSSMIHPLNLIQIEALKRKDENLLRETVTGIACGMMTTG